MPPLLPELGTTPASSRAGGGLGKGRPEFPKDPVGQTCAGAGLGGLAGGATAGPVITVSSPAPMRGRRREQACGGDFPPHGPLRLLAPLSLSPLSSPAGPWLPARLLPGPGSWRKPSLEGVPL